VCGRVTLTKNDIVEVARELAAEISAEDAALYRKRYNVAPSDLHWIVEYGADRRVLLPAVWGYLASGRPLINVRGEQVGSGSGFRDAFRERRCVVVTDGFLEWTAARAPFWYHRPDHGLVLLAGLYQTAGTAVATAGGAHPRFTILTTRANRLVSMVHGRMPVVLAPDHIDDWLTAAPTQIAALIAPAPEHALVATRVSKRVNTAKHDDPACLAQESAEKNDDPEAPPSAPDDRQRRLF
jgi:putative SOS response-associated peptidase YedK